MIASQDAPYLARRLSTLNPLQPPPRYFTTTAEINGVAALLYVDRRGPPEA